MTLKKTLGLGSIVLASTLALAACSTDNKETATDDSVLKVGIMTHTNITEPIWQEVEKVAKEDGLTLKFTEFTDYTQPNKALQNGEIDVNSFQHYNFMNDWNDKNKGDLVAAADTLLSPIRVFSGLDNTGKAKYTKIQDIPEGGTISVPNDATNESRALYLLQSAGLIELSVSGGDVATLDDIKSNPKDITIKEIDAAQAPSTLTSVDAAVINNNYAQDADVDYDTTLSVEAVNDDSKQWVNVIAAKEGWDKGDKAEAIKKLIKAYQTETIARLLREKSKGTEIPAWEGAPQD